MFAWIGDIHSVYKLDYKIVLKDRKLKPVANPHLDSLGNQHT